MSVLSDWDLRKLFAEQDFEEYRVMVKELELLREVAVLVRLHKKKKLMQLRLGVTFVYVTHDQEEALFLGDLVGVMNAGRLEQVGAPEAVYHRPATPFVAHFVGTADFGQRIGGPRDRAQFTPRSALE